MNGNAEFLNFIYQNSQMGVETIQVLIDIVKDEQFKQQLTSELAEYSLINNKAKLLLSQRGYDEKGLSAFEKIRTYLMINMQTLSDKSTSHVAEMMIIGSNMGVIDAIKNIKKYEDADQEVLELMKKLLWFEEANMQQLKLFL